jgi:hypothetical protein
MSTYPSPRASVAARADARNRAWRSFLQGLLIDLGVAVLPLIYDAVSGWDGAFSRTYWTAVVISVAKTIGVTVISYVMRRTVPPPNA